MPATPGSGYFSVLAELACGFVIGSILAAILINAINPIIVFLVIFGTIVAILDFADYMPAFSLAYFAGYIIEFLYPFAGALGVLRIPLLILALAGIAVVVAVKAGRRKERHTI